MATMRRHSRKRDAILQCIKECKEHPSAEWIYTHLKPAHPDLSLGTVYRNLALFRETGEVVTVATVHGVERWDAFTEPHSHFICDKCDAVLDIELPAEDLRSYLDTRYGYEVRRSEMIFRGVCDRCKEKDI